MFKSSPSPISFYSQNTGDRIVSRAKNIALNLSDDNNTFLRFNISKNILNDPISLLRTIESEVLNGTALLNRSAVTHVSKNNVFISYTNYLWSRNQDQLDGGGVPSTKKQTDVSWLLISLAMRDDKLRSLLFMHQIATLNGSINSSISKKVIKKNLDIDLGLVEVENVATMSATTSNTNLTYKEELAQKILQRIEQIIDVSTVTITNQDFVEKNAIYNALVGVNEFGLEVLNKIVVLMIKLDESGDWFKESNYRSGEISDNKLTPYSGIQKTSFYAAFFNLCCLIVHAANPERIVSRHGSKYVVKKVRKNIDIVYFYFTFICTFYNFYLE